MTMMEIDNNAKLTKKSNKNQEQRIKKLRRSNEDVDKWLKEIHKRDTFDVGFSIEYDNISEEDSINSDNGTDYNGY